MCGIVGYIGDNNVNFLINKLSKVEYRGYDSSGFANLKNGKIEVHKSLGAITNLIQKTDKEKRINCALAHTRWATHGKPSEINAHPHISKDKNFALVHNGIIENFNELKNKFNLNIVSETDTEVVVELLSKNKVDNIHSFIDTIKQLKGSYAFALINTKNENTMFVAKNQSPLYCAKKNNEILVASDPICFVNFSEEYYSLNDGEFALLKKGNITFYNKYHQEIIKSSIILDKILEAAEKGNYPHFMLKEIMEEKFALKRIRDCYSEQNFLNKIDKNFLKKFDKIEFIGCGTAYHAGLMGARYMEHIVKIPSSAYIASEFIYMNPLISSKTLYIFVSQSGETADTLRAMELVKSKGCKTLAISNVLYSTLAKNVDFVLPVCAGPEIAVASTKAYVCQLAVLYILAKHIKNIKNNKKYNYLNDLIKIEKEILNFDYKTLDEIAEFLKDKPQAIYIGKDLDFVTANEAGLKLKEISYIYASAYPSGELKHGFLAIVDEDTTMFVIANNKKLNDKTCNASLEAKSRGAQLVLIGGNEKVDILKPKWHIKLPDLNEYLLPIVSIAHLQYISYLVSIKKGLNPDKPRNLAKSVTVE